MGAIQSFSSVLPTLTGAIGTVQTIASTVNAVRNIADAPLTAAEQQKRQDEQALAQLKAQQDLQEQQLAQQAALEREKLAVSAGVDEQERQSALRRAVARQRAKFGSSGLGANASGSSEAVLLGLFEESEEERSKREKLDSLRAASIDLDLQQESSLNLLQATQLAEKQNLQRLF